MVDTYNRILQLTNTEIFLSPLLVKWSRNIGQNFVA